MPQIINTNLPSLNAQRNLGMSQTSLATSLQRLSSGLRINQSKDDAAGLAIATRMDAVIRGSQVALRNANDGISLAQTMEDAIGKLGDGLQRMRELAVQASNGTLSSGDRLNLQVEFQQMQAELLRVTSGTAFNGIYLLDTAATIGLAKAGSQFDFQIGANASGANVLTVSGASFVSGTLSGYFDIPSATLGSAVSSAALDLFMASTAQCAIGFLDSAIGQITTARAKWGAVQNRFDAVISSLQIFVENQTAAKSRIMDADFASETAKLTRSQILQQAGTAMLAQANSIPNGVLSLLR
ncbi:MAG: flagellin [Pseudomonadota bacterium]